METSEDKQLTEKQQLRLERSRERAREWGRKNRERMKERVKKWIKDNPERHKELSRKRRKKYYDTHREEIRAKDRNENLSSEELIEKQEERRRYNRHYKSVHAEAIYKRKLEKVRANGWAGTKTELTSYVESLKNVPCIRCNQMFPPECMDFDHVRGEKLSHVSELVKRLCFVASDENKRLLDNEVAKCDVICSNCHRIVTREREKDKWKKKWEEAFGTAPRD